VIVTENMFGDILSDLAGEIAGSLGIAPSLNSSDTHAMAQAAHGSAPDIAGRNVANPIAMNLSTAMLLDWLGAKHDDPRLTDAAGRLERGVSTAVAAGTRRPSSARPHPSTVVRRTAATTSSATCCCRSRRCATTR